MFEAFASAPKKSKKSVVVHVDYIPFLSAIAAAKLRFDYSGNTLLCFALGMVSEAASVLPTAGIRFLDFAPVPVQAACCKKNGQYGAVALAKWADKVELPTLLAQPVVAGAKLVEAYGEWKAAQVAE